MAEYIDRNAAVGILEAMGNNAGCRFIEKRIRVAAKRIGRIPAADVAPVVVRCKDCIHSYEDISGLCCSHGFWVDYTVPEDFFCANGEQKDGGAENASKEM